MTTTNSDWREFRLIKGQRIQVWKIRQLGDTYETTHGLLDGQMQVFSDTPGDKGKPGSKAYVDPVANCSFHISREVRKKEEHGYIEFIDGEFVKEASEGTSITFDKCLPKQFSSFKPQTDIKPEALVKLHDKGLARYSRKFDGNNQIAVHHTWGWEFYTRRMDLSTDRFPNHIAYLETLGYPIGTIIVGEMLCLRDDGVDDFKATSRVCRSLPEEARQLVADKEVPEPIYQIFDMLFHDGKNLSETSYDDRRKLWGHLPTTELVRPVELHKVTPENWESTAKAKGWEGFVVVDGSSKPGEKFFSFDGDAKRPKGHHKLKPTYTAEVVCFAGTQGTGKRGGGIGAIFVKQRHPDTGEWMNFGKCGSGFTQLDLEELEALFQKYNVPILEKDKDADQLDLNNQNNIIVELEYGERQPGTNKFRFPVFLRFRDDKSAKECYAQRLSSSEDGD